MLMLQNFSDGWKKGAIVSNFRSIKLQGGHIIRMCPIRFEPQPYPLKRPNFFVIWYDIGCMKRKLVQTLKRYFPR